MAYKIDNKNRHRELGIVRKHWECPDTVSLRDKNLQGIERDYVLECLDKIGKTALLADIGCGDASDTIYWCKYAKEVFGYDYSFNMIEKAKRISKGKIKLFQFDILKGALEQKFDVVITKRCLINLGSFENQRKAILKIHKSLKEHGHYIMLECCIEGLDKLNYMRKRIGLEPINEPYHNVYFEFKKLKSFIQKYFYIERIKPFSTYYFLTRIYNQALDAERFTKFDPVAKKFNLSFNIFGSDIIGPQFLMILKKRGNSG